MKRTLLIANEVEYAGTQRTHFVFLADLNLCEISGSHGGEYEDDNYLGYSAV
jgi:hypothetical protein